MNKFGKAILGTVFTLKEVPDGQQQEIATKTKPVVNDSQSDFSQTNTYQPEVNYHPMQATSVIGDTQKYKDHFNDLMDKSNMPAPDYYELSKTVDTLVDTIADYPTRFKAAFKMLTANGLTKEKALSSGQSYLTVLDNDAANFSAALQKTRANEIDAPKSQIDANTKRISDLQAQIQQLNTDNMNINQEIIKSDQRIASSKAGYELELSNIKQAIQTNLNYIQQFIQ